MPNTTDTSRFLQAIFPDHATRAIFAHSTRPTGMYHVRDLASLDGTRDCYWSVAGFPDDNLTKRVLDRALDVRALVIDDVGTKVPAAIVELALGRPTAIVESSLGNYQWTYRLQGPVPVDAWAGFFAGVEKLVGQRLDGRDAVHLFRLPMGVNSKNGFAVRLASLEPQNELVTGDINSASQSSRSGSGPGPSEPRIKNIRGILDLIPNPDVDYDAWIARAHQVKALALDEADGEEAFDEWSRKSVKYDEDETARRWATVRPSRTAGLVLLADAEGADPAGFAQVMNREAGAVFDDGVEPPEPSGPAMVRFKRGAQKQILSTKDNAERALSGYGISCRYDQFHHRVLVERRCGTVERLSDHLVLILRGELNAAYGKDFGPIHVNDAITALALANGFNPVTDMLAGAEAGWDGVKRLDRLGPDYFHTDDTALARECFRKVMLAAVRRARRPGCKFDQILVVESPEGWNKSSAWAVLAGEENFSDAPILGRDARAVQEELADIWIHEIADLSGLNRAEVEHVKAFASRTNDRARGAYARHLTDQPRQSVEVGTTNADAYLLSTTGNRRFWPFRLGAPVDLARLRADRMLLWGEAAAAESAGETLVLDAALWGAAGAEQEARRAIDPWEDELGNLVPMPAGAVAPVGCERIEVWNGDEFISNLSIHEYLAGYRRQAFHSGSGRKISEIMKRLGWERCSRKMNGAMARGYKRGPSSVSVSPTVSPNPF